MIISQLTNLWHLGGAEVKVELVSELEGENIFINSIEESVRDESVKNHTWQISSKFMTLLNAQELISLLQDLLLAINQAGTYICITSTNVLAYIELFNEVWNKLVEIQH